MDAKFTKGRWRRDKYGNVTNGRERICLLGIALYGNGDGKEEAEANTRLLLAAPAMFKAITEYLEWGPMTNSDRALFERTFRNVITLATGR